MTSYSIEILAVTASMLERIKELLGFPSPATPSETTHAIPAELAALNNGGLDWRIYRYDGWLLTLAANNTLHMGIPSNCDSTVSHTFVAQLYLTPHAFVTHQLTNLRT